MIFSLFASNSKRPDFASSLVLYFSIISIAASFAPPCNGPLKVPIAPVMQECMSDKVDAQVLAVKVEALNPCSAYKISETSKTLECSSEGSLPVIKDKNWPPMVG